MDARWELAIAERILSALPTRRIHNLMEHAKPWTISFTTDKTQNSGTSEINVDTVQIEI